MPLPPRQIAVLRYLGNHTATAGKTARGLHINRTAVRNALRGLADKGLVSVDRGTFPASWSLTDFGSAVLDAEPERES